MESSSFVSALRFPSSVGMAPAKVREEHADNGHEKQASRATIPDVTQEGDDSIRFVRRCGDIDSYKYSHASSTRCSVLLRPWFREGTRLELGSRDIVGQSSEQARVE